MLVQLHFKWFIWTVRWLRSKSIKHFAWFFHFLWSLRIVILVQFLSTWWLQCIRAYLLHIPRRRRAHIRVHHHIDISLCSFNWLDVYIRELINCLIIWEVSSFYKRGWPDSVLQNYIIFLKSREGSLVLRFDCGDHALLVVILLDNEKGGVIVFLNWRHVGTSFMHYLEVFFSFLIALRAIVLFDMNY